MSHYLTEEEIKEKTADIVVGRMAQGDDTVEVKFRTQKSTTKPNPSCCSRPPDTEALIRYNKFGIICGVRSDAEISDKPLVILHGSIKTPPLSATARIEAGVALRRLQQGGVI